MRGTPYVMRQADAVLAVTAALHAAAVRHAGGVDLRVGRTHWEVPLGSVAPSVPIRRSRHRRLGLAQSRRPIVTGGGLVFIGATLDRRLHAYDVDTGRELWHGDLPASAKATPISYDGRRSVRRGGGRRRWCVGSRRLRRRVPAATLIAGQRVTPKP